MSDFKDMQRRWAQPGRLEWIGLRPEKFAPMQLVTGATITVAGLDGDLSKAGKRAVTLIQGEHLAVIGAMLGRDAIAPEILRRNLVVTGINLTALRGRRVQIGAAEVEVTTLCAPCSRMEMALGSGGYSAMRGHGGWCAQVVTQGDISLGDEILPSN